MQLLEKPIARADLIPLAERMYGTLVKAVVDIERKIIVIDAEMHADQEAFLLDHGSRQEDLWGINFHPHQSGEAFVEFDSMINVRPRQNNRSRGVEDPAIREKIRAIVNLWITE